MRGLGAAVVLLMAVGSAAAQLPTVEPPPVVKPAAATPEPNPWVVPPKLPEVKAPVVRVPDYFGPSITQPFNEKALFPTPPKLDPPPTPAPDGLPPPPGIPPPVVVPDGSLPTQPPPRVWRGGTEFGVTGSQGNSDVLALRFGANISRKVERNLFGADLLYAFSQQDGATKQNQAFLYARDEILFPGSPWSTFSALQLEYDQLQSYDLRVGEYAGVSYRWLKTDATVFKTRLGAGAIRQMDTRQNGPPDKWVPEAVVGDDFNHRFTDRQAFVSTLDVFPNLSQLGQFRVRARAGYEIVIDPSHGMVLRLGVQERYDSNPGPAKRNDLNYFTTLMFRF